jgi:ferredoxin-NADP reductase
LTGRADAVLRRVLEEWPDVREGVAYMCGNPDMIASCTDILTEAGFRAADIRAERFHAPAPRA